MDDMAWVVLGAWVLVALVALPLARHALTETPLLGLQLLVGLAGLTLAIVFVAGSPSETLAWVMVGVGIAGAATVGLAAAWLTSDQHPSRAARQQGAEEGDALLAGVELPLFVVASFAALMLALFVGA
jgi:hypothetical protein